MGIFSAIVKTVIETATLPVAVVKDVVTLGGDSIDGGDCYTTKKVKQIKKAAQDDTQY